MHAYAKAAQGEVFRGEEDLFGSLPRYRAHGKEAQIVKRAWWMCEKEWLKILKVESEKEEGDRNAKIREDQGRKRDPPMSYRA